ncbi:glycoside hydrolase family 95 protein [Echinicola pacifica]|nr:glycoside hydrolase N-terminal domain-containing protein [Echinicola pacifica]
MKIQFCFLFICLTIFSFGQSQDTMAQSNKDPLQHILWYENPAEVWKDALPVGNGRLGGMVFGQPSTEHIQLNEDSLWPGAADWGEGRGNAQDLAKLRELILNGQVHEADEKIIEFFSYRDVIRSHQTMGDLYLNFDHTKEITNYQRQLDMSTGVSKVSYQVGGHSFEQTVFASAPDDVMVIHLSTDLPEGFSLAIDMERPLDEGHQTVKVHSDASDQIMMTGEITQYGAKKDSESRPLDYGVKFKTIVKVHETDGKTSSDQGTLHIKGARTLTLLLIANTSFHQTDIDYRNQVQLDQLSFKTYDQLLKSHIQDFSRYYNRTELVLGDTELNRLPIDKRLQRLKEGHKDADLAAKLFHYGRYLLISSSRPGTNPANLQGLWNKDIVAPWNADYHLNINLQMNYWPAGPTQLQEMELPLFDLIDRMIERGKITARQQYGISRGSVIHHTSDLWAAPWMRAKRAYWGAWIHGGGWISRHYWEHYQFTADTTFLENRAYPALKEIASFYVDWLQKDAKTGKYISSPESSPENSYYAADGKPAALSYGSAMGHQIISDVFQNTLAAAHVLGIDDEFTAEVQERLDNLFSGVSLGPDGRILEWNEPYDEPEKGHRHMSHLYALHPGDDITENNKAEFEGAQKTIDYRLQHGGAGTGWSRAWMINFNARLLDATSAEDNLYKLLQISTGNNLFNEHPPFQIDGNFGYTAGLAELLLQSHEGFIRILPALPPSWKNGAIKGLVARGNIIIDISWENGQAKQIRFKSPADQSIKVLYLGEMHTINLKKSETKTIDL